MSDGGGGADDGPSSASSGTFSARTYGVGPSPTSSSSAERDPEVDAERISPLLNDYDLVLIQKDFADADADPAAAGSEPSTMLLGG